MRRLVGKGGESRWRLRLSETLSGAEVVTYSLVHATTEGLKVYPDSIRTVLTGHTKSCVDLVNRRTTQAPLWSGA